MTGRVTAVKRVRVGTELATAASSGDDELDLVEPDELDRDGGSLLIGSEIHTYTIDDADVVSISGTLASGYSAEEPVYMDPPVYERLAYLLGPGQERELEARVPHSLYDRLPVGIREDNASAEFLEVANVDGEYVVTDALGKEPQSDVAFLSGLEMNAGRVSVTAPSSPAAYSAPIEHGLSDVPHAVIATVDHVAGSRRFIATAGDLGADTFTVGLRSNDDSDLNSTFAGEIWVYWVALRSSAIVGVPSSSPG